MNPVLLKAIIGVMQQMPQMAADLDKMVKEVESGDDVAVKVKELIGGAVDLFQLLIKDL